MTNKLADLEKYWDFKFIKMSQFANRPPPEDLSTKPKQLNLFKDPKHHGKDEPTHFKSLSKEDWDNIIKHKDADRLEKYEKEIESKIASLHKKINDTEDDIRIIEDHLESAKNDDAAKHYMGLLKIYHIRLQDCVDFILNLQAQYDAAEGYIKHFSELDLHNSRIIPGMEDRHYNPDKMASEFLSLTKSAEDNEFSSKKDPWRIALLRIMEKQKEFDRVCKESGYLAASKSSDYEEIIKQMIDATEEDDAKIKSVYPTFEKEDFQRLLDALNEPNHVIDIYAEYFRNLPDEPTE